MLAALKKNKTVYRRLRLVVACLGCLFLAWSIYEIWIHFFSDSTVHLRMSAGPVITRRHQIAEFLQESVKPTGIHVNLIPTVGSEEALQQVNSGELDLAIVSSGILTSGKTNVREIASLQIEPVHLLLRKELAGQSGLLRAILRSKRVNLGEPGSSAYALAKELLAFARLQPTEDPFRPGDFVAVSWGVEELMRRCREISLASGSIRDQQIQDLPDAVLLVASMPSKVAQALIETADYRLVPLPFARAFVSNTTQDESQLNRSVDHGYIEQIVIPAGSYLGSQPIPAQDCETIGLRLLLVANKNVPTGVIFRLMSGVFEGEFARRMKPRNPVDHPSPYDVHLGTLAYLNRNQPYLFNTILDVIRKITSAFGLFSAGALSFYALLRTKRHKSASDYLKEIRQIDLLARGLTQDEQVPTETTALRNYLDQWLVKLKSELIQDCCKKKFKNEMMLLNILTLLADAQRQVGELGRVSGLVPEREDSDRSIPAEPSRWKRAA